MCCLVLCQLALGLKVMFKVNDERYILYIKVCSFKLDKIDLKPNVISPSVRKHGMIGAIYLLRLTYHI